MLTTRILHNIFLYFVVGCLIRLHVLFMFAISMEYFVHHWMHKGVHRLLFCGARNENPELAYEANPLALSYTPSLCVSIYIYIYMHSL